METPTQTARVLAAQAGDQMAFDTLVEPYRREAGADDYQLFGLVVLGVEGEQIASLVAFLELSGLSFFALPPTLPHLL